MLVQLKFVIIQCKYITWVAKYTWNNVYEQYPQGPRKINVVFKNASDFSQRTAASPVTEYLKYAVVSQRLLCNCEQPRKGLHTKAAD